MNGRWPYSRGAWGLLHTGQETGQALASQDMLPVSQVLATAPHSDRRERSIAAR